MASYATRRTRRAVAFRRAAAAIATSCCVLGLASLPRAGGEKLQLTSSATSSGEGPAAPRETRAEREAQEQGCCAVAIPPMTAPPKLPPNSPRLLTAGTPGRRRQPPARLPRRLRRRARSGPRVGPDTA